ncbi:MAG: hypothetical protein COW00_00260 [Bdellovibrio sp. CG12_big_fil_rev_8_21_14_0_65_39_13]|nr:MAG: hypothetical protein COW78_19835 [Bdellovibrio sp. CG22_combo_CG10-13_8_21_14_all_39_27]PIQ62916.1 MAG: hypothetical protein COW00_00260 [Bdellovibrio sp. CG12_big_fil_rev_8_21_14_0_65_39_13]PIR33271.1 MAG: hypothetical protein COV37_16995 [Bdellovibrio sp. CG11_big_fil_rev_8_21_14_0_20_39_38]
MLKEIKNFILGLNSNCWQGERPPLYLWAKFCSESQIKLTKNSKLIWANATLFEEWHGQKYLGEQQIEAPKRSDRILGQSSSFREMAQVRVVTDEGIVIEGPVIKGGMKKVSNSKELSQVVHQLSFKARKLGLKIAEIEIAHSHKGLEVLVIEGQDAQLIMNGLSQADRKTGQYLGERFHYPLRIKAITEKLTYSMIF